MLESIREGVQKPWVKIVIFAIVISFVFAGYFSSAFFLGDPNAVAIINGESISRNDFQRAYASVKAQRAEFYKANVKTEEDEKNFQENVLQRLVTLKVREQATKSLGLRLSTDALRNVIQSDPNYQMNGKYSSALVDQVLVRAQITRAEFKNDFEVRTTDRQLLTGLLDSEFSLASEVESDFKYTAQKRTGRALQINVAQFKQEINLTDDEVNQYYQDNLEKFRQEEKISVEYVELSASNLQSEVTPTEDEIKDHYEENLDRYKADEQRQISHILILSEDSESAALEKINAIKKRIDSGEDFAEIAKAESDDIPTRESGGDLGILIAGAVEKPLEDAANALTTVGEVSEPVKSDFGYHLIKLTKVVEGSALPIEEVKDELVVELKKSKAEVEFQNKLDTLTNKAFEVADSLKEAAEATGLQVKTSPLFGASSRQGIFANQNVKDIAFSVEVKESLLNSEPIQIADNHVIVLRLKEYKASEIQPLEKVKPRVESELKQSKAKSAAEQLANTLLEKLKAKESIEDLIVEKKLSWTDLNQLERNNASLSYLTNQQFFKMKKPKPDNVTVDMVDDFQGFTILMLNKVEDGNWAQAEEANKKQRSLYISSYYSNAAFSAFINDYRRNSDIKRNLDNLIQ
ncbi:SurA N-terminal domain-containing protein [Aliikangiella sp. IMCC44359]|uniref:SurA N-terminal domain-containing protein n=1 Tax=Aliikangiella sp. IMCC44359 TaxID=3459125 RepID=UPI00403AB22F